MERTGGVGASTLTTAVCDDGGTGLGGRLCPAGGLCERGLVGESIEVLAHCAAYCGGLLKELNTLRPKDVLDERLKEFD